MIVTILEIFLNSQILAACL